MTGGQTFSRALAVAARLLALVAGCALTHPLAAQESDWQLEPTARVEVGVVSAETATSDDQLIVNGDAFTVRAQAGLDFEDDDTRFRLEVDRIEVLRFEEDRANTNRTRLTAQFDQELSKDWDIQLRARHFDDVVTAESADTDEIQGSVRVSYEPQREHRFRLRASWREREYDNRDDAGVADPTTGSGPRVDAGYRHRLGRYHYINFDLRAESISSDDPDRGFQRQSAKISYTKPITPDLRVRPALELLNTRFDGRFGEDGEQRSDQLVVPELELHYWPGPWRIEAEAKYIFSNSNLLAREREGYRLTLTAGYVF